MKKYYKKINTRERFSRRINIENLKQKHLKSGNVGNQEGHFANESPKKNKANIKMFEDFNELELFTDNSESYSINYLSDKNLSNSYSEWV